MSESIDRSVVDGLRLQQDAHIGLKLFRYFFVGGAAALTEWTLFALMLYWGGLHYMLAAPIAFIFSTLVNYLLGLLVVFHGGRHTRHKEVVLVYLVSAVGLLINLLVLFVLVDYAGTLPMLAKVAATGAAFIWNFTARHRWVFA